MHAPLAMSRDAIFIGTGLNFFYYAVGFWLSLEEISKPAVGCSRATYPAETHAACQFLRHGAFNITPASEFYEQRRNIAPGSSFCFGSGCRGRSTSPPSNVGCRTLRGAVDRGCSF